MFLYLLPTIVVLKRTLEELKKDKVIVHCKPLVNAVYNGVCSCFDDLFYDNELRVASLSHPRFKLSWVPEDEIDSAVRFLKNEMISSRLAGQHSLQPPKSAQQADAKEREESG